MGIPLIDIYSVATFYKSFSLTPKGKHQVVTCSGTACHVRGSEKVTEEISRVLNLKKGTTSKDGEYSLECVNCVGACALAPLVIVDGQNYGHMTPSKVRSLFKDKCQNDKTDQVEAGLSEEAAVNSALAKEICP